MVDQIKQFCQIDPKKVWGYDCRITYTTRYRCLRVRVPELQPRTPYFFIFYLRTASYVTFIIAWNFIYVKNVKEARNLSDYIASCKIRIKRKRCLRNSVFLKSLARRSVSHLYNLRVFKTGAVIDVWLF